MASKNVKPASAWLSVRGAARRPVGSGPVAQVLSKSVVSPIPGTVVQIPVSPGERVAQDSILAVVEAMKMEHEVRAEQGGRLVELYFDAGALVAEGELLGSLERVTQSASEALPAAAPLAPPQPGTANVRADLQRMLERHAPTLDANRAEAVAKRHALGQRTARENIADLLRRLLAVTPPVRVLVVDDDSPDGTAAAAAAFT